MKYTIRLDICTICNLNCPTCTMRILNYGKLGAGYIKFETYKKFIDDHKGRIKRIEISSAGEPFSFPSTGKVRESLHGHRRSKTGPSRCPPSFCPAVRSGRTG